MALPKIHGYGEYISLIPDSGIQFVDIEFQRAPFIPKSWRFADADHCVLRENEPVDPGRQAATDHHHGEGFTVDFSDVVEMLKDEWVPVPFLHRLANSDQFDKGPTNWVRARLVPLPDAPASPTPKPDAPASAASRYRIVLAVDTRLLERPNKDHYVAPCPADAGAGIPFELPGFEDNSGPYFEQDWIREWCFDLYRKMLERKKLIEKNLGTQRDQMRREQVLLKMQEAKAENHHVAIYRAFVDLLWVLQTRSPTDRIALPPMKLEKRIEEPKAEDDPAYRRFIDVTLVLDLGNSRTCGLIIETDRGGDSVDWSKTDRLQLRDLSRPELVYDDPFPSRFVFANALFGDDDKSDLTGHFRAFRWPSNVRIGYEAEWLSSQSRHVQGVTGLSSPKRYLWDEDIQSTPWKTFDDKFTVGDRPTTTLFINEVGKPLHQLKPDSSERLAAGEGRFARSNLTSLALAEVVLQAISMMNSPGHRHAKAKLHDHTRPRRLHTVIMTTPTAMPLAERAILKTQTQNAIELACLALRLAKAEPAANGGRPSLLWEPAARPTWNDPKRGPEVKLDWDEASATQAVYLYTQVAQNYSGDARAFFDDYRHPANRNNPEMPPDTLRLATIDVGGGTTDLVITSVSVEGEGSNLPLLPRHLFREGFNLAGDDVLLAVINACLLTPLESMLAAHGAKPELANRLFSGAGGGQVAQQAHLRQQFVAQLAAPAGIELLGRYERYDPLQPANRLEIKLRDLFPSGGFPKNIAEEVERQCEAGGALGIVLGDLPLAIDFGAIDALVRTTFRKSLVALGEVIHHYRCDVLILSGRASRLPAVRAMLIEHSGLPAHRVVPMHGLDVPGWYPFRTPEGTIDDPKTTAAVGAVVCYLGERRQLFNFPLRASEQGDQSTAHYFGKLDQTRTELPNGPDVFIEDLRLHDSVDEQSLEGSPITFETAMPLGFRQLSVARWPATQLYWLKLSLTEAAQKYIPLLPFKVELAPDKSRPMPVRERRANSSERVLYPCLMIKRITCGKGEETRTVPNDVLRLRLQTLGGEGGEGHWLDTGALK